MLLSQQFPERVKLHSEPALLESVFGTVSVFNCQHPRSDRQKQDAGSIQQSSLTQALR